MNRARTAILLASAFLAAATAGGQEWRGPASIAVEVKGKPHGRVQGALVILRYQQVQPAAGPRPVLTDASGQAVLTDLAPGVWEVEVSHEDFLSYVALVVLDGGRKPTVQTSFLQASGSSLTPIRVKFTDGRGRAPSPSVPLPPEAAARLAARQPPPLPEARTPQPTGPPRVGTRRPAPPVMPEPELRPLPSSAQPAAAPAPPEPAVAPEPEALTTPAPPPAEPDAPEAPAPEPPAAAAEPTPPPAPAPQPAAPPVEPPSPPAEPPAPPAEPEPPVEPAAPPAEPATQPAAAPEMVPAPAEPDVSAYEPPAAPAAPEPEPPAPAEPEPVPTPAAPDPVEPEPEPRQPPLPVAPTQQPAEAAPPPPPAAETAPPMPEPAPPPAAVPPEPRPDTASLPPPGPLGPTLRAYRDRTCVECRPGEWALSVETVAGPSSGPCDEAALAADGAALAKILGGSIALELKELAAPAPRALAEMDSGEAATRGAELLGDASSSCRVVAVVIPKAGRFRGLRMEAADASGVGDCQADRDCPVGQARWLGQPRVSREPSANVIWGLFVNQAPDRARRARLTVYFAAPYRAWEPPGQSPSG